jgi:hypothetical protein
MQVPLPPLSTLTVKRALWLAVALALTAVLVAVFRGQIYRLLLPLFLREITWLGDDFRIIGIGVQHIAADTYIGVNAGIARPILGAGKILYPDSGFELTAATLAGYLLQTIILFAGILLAWPVHGWLASAMRVALGIPALLLALMSDMPLVLLSILWQGVLTELGDKRFSALLAWGNFLHYGGRLGLVVFAGIATVLLAEALTRAISNRDDAGRARGCGPV